MKLSYKYAVFDHNTNEFFISMTMSAIEKKYKKTHRQVRYIVRKGKPVKGLSIGRPTILKIKSRLGNIDKSYE